MSIAAASVLAACAAAAPQFVTVSGRVFKIGGMTHHFIGANYWYGGLLGLEKDERRGVVRLRKELDFLKANGINNLRLMAGAEGSGPMNGITRVGPPLQPLPGEFDETVLDGLDLVLYEMKKRDMQAVIFLSNNWEWSGGFQQYLIWNGVIGGEYLTRKPDWDDLRDTVSKFYSCDTCKDGYDGQVRFVLGHRNKYGGRRYVDDPTIMAWEIANEPRPLRPAAADEYKRWIARAAALIKSLDSTHLVTTGHEGWIGTESIDLFEAVHRDRNIDYLTIHIWPKNWGWFKNGRMAEDFENVLDRSRNYVDDNAAVAARLGKPLVIEEFGLPRDGQAFGIGGATSYRDKYYKKILSLVGGDYIAGASFWAFGGSARPDKSRTFWRPGDDLTGDPPMEEQGLNSVFDTDETTWNVIRTAGQVLRNKPARSKGEIRRLLRNGRISNSRFVN